jgi:hypothetical protein
LRLNREPDDSARNAEGPDTFPEIHTAADSEYTKGKGETRLAHLSAVYLGTLAALLSASVCLKAQSATVQGSLADQGKPVKKGVINLQRLAGEDCAKLLVADGREMTDAENKKASKCGGKNWWDSTDSRGNYKFKGLEPGWYIVRIQWPMAQPPDTKEPVGCSIRGWSVSYVPWKEMGKNRGAAQGPPFELQAGDEKTLEFDYNAEFKIQKDCSKPLQWRKQ